MISNEIKNKIITFWDEYIKTGQVVLDTRGNPFEDINESRLKAIEDIKLMINSFLKNEINIFQFKTSLDSYNKHHNLWGFTATKGQMFFNQLTKNNEENIDTLTNLLKQVITEPKNLDDALNKIETLENLANDSFLKVKDKRTAPNPASVPYFLSYFWQMYDYKKWPIMYSSLIVSFKDLGIWIDKEKNQKEVYSFFYNLNEEIKEILKNHTKIDITNWDLEHAFWKQTGKPTPQKTKKEDILENTEENEGSEIKVSVNIEGYLIEKIKNLVELGNKTETSGAAKGSQYEKLVAEIFGLLGFEVDFYGQGSRRNPDAIIKFRKKNIAFIVDAKAYENGYALSANDERAIKEYIDYHCPILKDNGYEKIGFIIVSNSFRSNFEEFINKITWDTDIKRFMLLTSKALLCLFAYKTKDNLDLESIIESLIGFDNLITADDVIEYFDDV